MRKLKKYNYLIINDAVYLFTDICNINAIITLYNTTAIYYL